MKIRNDILKMDSSDYVKRVFDGSSTYRLLGRIHWIINFADNINEKLCKSQSKASNKVFRPAGEILSSHGKRYCSQEITWWIYQKENNSEELFLKTEDILQYVEKIYKDFHSLKSLIPKNYEDLLIEINKFNEIHALEIQKLLEYVEYLASIDPIRPIILFSFESAWSSTELSERSYFTNQLEPSDDSIKSCANIVLGICSSHGFYSYNRIQSEIQSEMFDQYEGDTPVSTHIDQKKLIFQVSREILDRYEVYLRNIRDSIRDIILKIEKFNKENFVIREIILDFPNKSVIKIGLIELDYDLVEIEGDFGYYVSDEIVQKRKIISAIQKLESYDVNIICFPELSIKKEWVNELCPLSIGKIIVGGSYYDQSYNICPLFVNGQLIKPSYSKINPSPFEGTEIYGKKMKSGKTVYIYKTPQFSFVILTCIDNPKIVPTLLTNPEFNIDIVINPCYDEKIERFQQQCDIYCNNSGVFFILTNRSEKEGMFGRTSFLASEHKEVLKRFEGKTRNKDTDSNSVIASISEEEILLAEIDTGNKGPTVPTRLGYVARIKPLNVFRYCDGDWVEQF